MSAAVELANLRSEIKQRDREILAAQTADLALRWFEQYASSAMPDTEFELSFTCASKCVGATEASGYLERATLVLRAEIYRTAALLASEDLERVLPASAIEARSDAAPQSDAAEGESATGEAGDAQ